jgi:hypothetical protein
MNDSIHTILTVCGLGIGGCISVFLLVLLVLFLTGRWMMIPTVVAIVPQLLRTVLGGGMGIFRGLDLPTDTPSDNLPTSRTRGNRSTSASERIRQRREQFTNDALSPERRPFEQGGQRGPLGDRYDIRPSKGIRTDDDSRRSSRDDRRKEWNEDEIFGGMFEDE